MVHDVKVGADRQRHHAQDPQAHAGRLGRDPALEQQDAGGQHADPARRIDVAPGGAAYQPGQTEVAGQADQAGGEEQGADPVAAAEDLQGVQGDHRCQDGPGKGFEGKKQRESLGTGASQAPYPYRMADEHVRTKVSRRGLRRSDCAEKSDLHNGNIRLA